MFSSQPDINVTPWYFLMAGIPETTWKIGDSPDHSRQRPAKGKPLLLVIMSETVLSRLDTVRIIQEKRLSVTRAAQLHGASRRQVHRWLVRLANEGKLLRSRGANEYTYSMFPSSHAA